MDTSSASDARLTELEIKLAFAEEQIDGLNNTAFLQQRQIEQLQLALQALRTQMLASQPDEAHTRVDEIPPHY